MRALEGQRGCVWWSVVSAEESTRVAVPALQLLEAPVHVAGEETTAAAVTMVGRAGVVDAADAAAAGTAECVDEAAAVFSFTVAGLGGTVSREQSGW